MSTPRTESAPWSAPADDGGDPITAGLERVQAASDGHSGVPDAERPTELLGPPRVILQPGDLLEVPLPSPPPRTIADVIADSARTVLALSALPSTNLDALAREIGANAAQVLAVGDPIERLIASAKAILPHGATSVQLFESGDAAIQFTVFNADTAEALAADLDCDPLQPDGDDDGWRRTVRGTWSDPVRLVLMGPDRPMHPITTAADQTASEERAA